MIKKYIRRINMFMLAVVVPCLYGCGGGGGGGVGEVSGFLFNGGGSSGDTFTAGIVSSNVPTLTNPEPATMLLIGGGMAAMAYYKSKKK